jgi:hypothetical protein
VSTKMLLIKRIETNTNGRLSKVNTHTVDRIETNDCTRFGGPWYEGAGVCVGNWSSSTERAGADGLAP